MQERYAITNLDAGIEADAPATPRRRSAITVPAMAIQDEANLILRLYELRREETMRKARDWYFMEFNPEKLEEFTAAMMGPHSGHLRMVISYWDMAAALVNNNAISMHLFNDCNSEHIGVFAKIEKLLPEIRAAISPRYAANLELLIDATPDGRKMTEANRGRMKQIRERLAASRQQAAS